VLAKKDSIE